MAIAKPFWTPELHIGQTNSFYEPYYGGPQTDNLIYGGIGSYPILTDDNIVLPQTLPYTTYLDGILTYFRNEAYNTIFNVRGHSSVITFSDNDYNPSLDGSLFVRVNQTKILPLLWNMKEWNVQFNASFSITDARDYAEGGITDPINSYYASINKSGKFSYSNISFYIDSEDDMYVNGTEDVFIPNKEPSYNVGGEKGYLSHKIINPNYYFLNDYNKITDKAHVSRSLPDISSSIRLPEGSSGTVFTKNVTHDTPAGSNNLNISGSSIMNSSKFYDFWGGINSSLSFKISKIVLLPDGTAYIHFSVGAFGDDTILSVGGSDSDGQLEGATRFVEFYVSNVPATYSTYSENIPSPIFEDQVVYYDTTYMNIGSTTISVFGVEKEVYLNVNALREYASGYEGYRETTPADYTFDFSLSYDIDVSEFWEYE